MAACAANLRIRSDLHRPGTPYSFAPAPSTRGLRDPRPAWAESRPHDCARVRDPDARDAIDLCRSQATSCGPGPGVLPHRRGVFTWRPAPWRSAPWGRKSAGTKGAQGEACLGEKFCEANPVGAPKASFRRPLRGRLPVLRCCPFARFPGLMLLGKWKKVTRSAEVPSTVRRAAAGRSAGSRRLRPVVKGRGPTLRGGLRPVAQGLVLVQAWSLHRGVLAHITADIPRRMKAARSFVNRASKIGQPGLSCGGCQSD